MSTILANIFFIFCLTLNVQIGWSIYECADCDKTSRGTCEIKGEPGFSCGVYNRRKARDVKAEEDADYEHPTTTTDLKVCIPKELNVTDLRDEYPICCVWSVELGCQLLADSSNDWWDCGSCRRKTQLTYSDLKTCPCEENLGSRKVYSTLWHFVIPTYLLYKCFT